MGLVPPGLTFPLTPMRKTGTQKVSIFDLAVLFKTAQHMRNEIYERHSEDYRMLGSNKLAWRDSSSNEGCVGEVEVDGEEVVIELNCLVYLVMSDTLWKTRSSIGLESSMGLAR